MALITKHGSNIEDENLPTYSNPQAKPLLVNFTFTSIVSRPICFNTQTSITQQFWIRSMFLIKYISWIIDSGASYHVACSLELFISIRKVRNAYAQLPNNLRVVVT